MKQKAFVLQNKGMNRDLSISKAGESSAYENHNIRILARDHDTLLSVTNERGNKVAVMNVEIGDNLRITEDEELRITEDELFRTVGGGTIETLDFQGVLIGWNVLNEYVILFTNEGDTDRIYRIRYDGENFWSSLLFEGSLGFSLDHPIESVVYHETEDILKIYWVDGINVLRFMNFKEEPDDVTGLFPWQISEDEYDNTYFDSNRAADFGVKATITKDNSGNTRANGTIQYLLTYFNKHGQETGYVWVSDLVYLSPAGRGGAADEYNTNKVTITLSNLDTSFDHFRIYSIFRSSLNGKAVAYIVEDSKTYSDSVSIIDDGANQTSIDATSLLYLGSQPVHASTLTHKDQTLFLGDLVSVGHDYTSIENITKTLHDKDGYSTCVHFDYSEDGQSGISDIPYVVDEGTYPYENQLAYTSSQILTFKGGEKYRFALKFQLRDGTESPAFWIGDAENTKYPVVNGSNKSVKRVIAWCELPSNLLAEIKNSDLDIQTVQLCIAEATYADRSVKAQGIINPTMFNTWERFNKRLYAIPSWISRPRGMEYANRHFQPVQNARTSYGEIACNWWNTEEEFVPKAYYQYTSSGSSREFVDDYPGVGDYDYLLVAYILNYEGKVFGFKFSTMAYVFRVFLKQSTPEAQSAAMNYSFREEEVAKFLFDNFDGVIHEDDNFKVVGTRTPWFNKTVGLRQWSSGASYVYLKLAEYLLSSEGLSEAFGEVVSQDQFTGWFGKINEGWTGTSKAYYTAHSPRSGHDDFMDALNHYGTNKWVDASTIKGSGPRVPSYYEKHYMFVDENTVTLNSPELDYEAVQLDSSDLKLRIVGVAKVNAGMSDYTVVASQGKMHGEHLVDEKFSWTSSFGNESGLLSWPLWREKGLDENRPDEDELEEGEIDTFPEEVDKRTSENYVWGGSVVKYWLYMWGRNGNITGFDDGENVDFDRLSRKVFANLKFSYETKYCNYNSMLTYTPESSTVRHYNYLSSQYVQVKVGGESKFYNGNVHSSLSIPGKFKYPILYSTGDQDTNVSAATDKVYLYTQEPVQIEYLSSPHVVLSLGSKLTGGTYTQTILPYVKDSDRLTDTIPAEAHIPWLDNADAISYQVDERRLNVSISEDDNYILIGELYSEFNKNNDNRYGGITDTDIANNRFIAAGPQFTLDEIEQRNNYLFANQGDTYFQRWDCLKTKPYSTGSVNNVIDITSVMLETHINIDGRTDLLRGINELASIDPEKFGALNTVYSQTNNYHIQHDLDEDFNQDTYRSSITWSLEKHDSADIDEWSHVTLASTLKLDGDKGWCRALRRMGNTIISFQDRGISEILFNSRTQLSTQDGVPVEIANSGKVDGKRYITNKYGCTNKWSIIEGKNALYFVDNINKAFCAFNGQAIDNLSTRLGFGAWFREINNTEPWKPADFNNIVSYYDKVHSDIYLVRNTSDDKPCLVYNETLGAFTSFFDYSTVLMMTNVEDRFVSYRNHRMWLQNEGLYCNFFGQQYDYWTQYRVTPEPYSDKIWTNIDYRADFFEVLDASGHSTVPETDLINGDLGNSYKEWETFTDYKVWDEYQDTGFTPFAHDNFDRDDVRKKFRIWRLTIPRAMKEGTNKHGLDRIRNPWINLLFRKNNVDGKYLMQLHDIVVKYFE